MTTENSRQSINLLEDLVGGPLTLGNYLKSIRQCDELTQDEFAIKLNTSKQYICDLEHARRFLSVKTAAKYAHILGYSHHQFMRLALRDQQIQQGLSTDIDLRDVA